MKKVIAGIVVVALAIATVLAYVGISLFSGIVGTTIAAKTECIPGLNIEHIDTGGDLDVAPFKGVSLDPDGVTIKRQLLSRYTDSAYGKYDGAHRAKMITMVVAIGLARGVPEYGWQIALATATQESGIANLGGGDRDSGGLFQQRPSVGLPQGYYWGSYKQVRTPRYAINRFYQELDTIDNWENRELWDVAQDIQGSAYPYAYEEWKNEAANTLDHITIDESVHEAELVHSDSGADIASVSQPTGDAALADVDCMPTGTASATSGALNKAISHALIKSQEPGVKYVFGAAGPKAYDCSSFLQWAFGEAGIELPRTSRQQWEYEPGEHIDPGEPLKRGDLVFWAKGGDVSSDQNDIYHVGLYLGDVSGEEQPQLLDAANPERGVGMHDMYFGDDYVGALRLTVAEETAEPAGGWGGPFGPLTMHTYSNSYGPRTHPVTGQPDFHNGDDLGAACGTPILAVGSGEVKLASYTSGWGNTVVLQHGRELYSLSAHMTSFASSVGVGSEVTKGQVIGYVGSTGLSTGCHLHLTMGTSMEILSGDEAGSLDPYPFFKARGVDLASPTGL